MRREKVTFPFCGSDSELQPYIDSFNNETAVKCHMPVAGQKGFDFYGVVVEIRPGSQVDGLHQRKITVRPCPEQRQQAEDRCRCVPIPVLDQPDRRYVPFHTGAGYKYHISEMKDLQLPTLTRPVLEAALAHWETWQRYELGEMYMTGELEFTVEMTGRNAYMPSLGALAEVDLDSVKWSGYIEHLNPIYFGNRPTQLRITLRPTGGPVFPNQQPVTKESSMKVFEAIVVTVNEQNVVTGIAKGVQLVVAADAQAAKDQVLVDYAAEAKLTGKDLAGFKVRTREFCS